MNAGTPPTTPEANDEVAAKRLAETDSLGSTILSSVGWAVAEKWGSRAFGIIVFIILGRLLSPDDFGLVALASVFVALSNILTDSGMSKAVIQRVNLTSDHVYTAFWMNLVASILVVLAFIIGSPYMERALHAPGLAPVISIQALAILFAAFSEMPEALLEREFRFKSLAKRKLVGVFVGGTVSVLLAFAGAGVWSLVAQILVTNLVSIVTLWRSTSWRPAFRFSIRALRELWGVSYNVLGIEFVSFFNIQGDRLLIGIVAGPTTLGYYFFAFRIISLLSELLSTVFSSVSLTTFSRLQNDRERLISWLYRFVSGSSVISIPLFLLLAASASVTVPLVFGGQWKEAIGILQILSFLGAINSIAFFDRSVLIATGNARAAFLMTVGACIVALVLVWIALPYGVFWVAMAVVSRQYLYWPVRLAVLKRAIGLVPGEYVKRLAIPMCVSLAACAPVYWIAGMVPAQPISQVLFVLVSPFLCLPIYVLGMRLFGRSILADFDGLLAQGTIAGVMHRSRSLVRSFSHRAGARM